MTKDPYEWNHLAKKPEFAEIKAELRKELLAWMEAMGDKGRQTEMEAREHQGGGRKRRVSSKSGKQGAQGKRSNAP